MKMQAKLLMVLKGHIDFIECFGSDNVQWKKLLKLIKKLIHQGKNVKSEFYGQVINIRQQLNGPRPGLA